MTYSNAPTKCKSPIKRIGGTLLAGAIVAAVSLQVAPATALAATRPKQAVNVKATHAKVIDYAGGFSSSTPSVLKKHGVKIVVRYVGYPSGSHAWKNLSKGEDKALRKADIDIAAVYETSASWMSGGYQAGVSAAKTAKADIVANGGPKRPFVYFACDEDANYIGKVNATLRGAAHVLGHSKVGIYGGYRVVNSALRTHSAAKGWQTMAWSNGRVAKGIALYQTIRTYEGKLGGLGYDSNFAKQDDIGQWGTHALKTPPAKKQTLAAPAPAPKQASAAVAPARPSRNRNIVHLATAFVGSLLSWLRF